jgi:single-strand DNA-binding protein
MGRLTADPDYRQTPQGTPVCKFTVAVDRGFVSKETGQKETDFINVTAWRGTADLVSRHFSKGKPIIVEGSLRIDNYTDRNGVKQYWTYVVANAVYFCLRDNSQGGNGNYGNYGNGYGNPYPQGDYGNGGYQQGGYAPQGNNNGYYQQPQQPQQPAPAPYQQPVNNSAPAPNPVSNNVPEPKDADVQLGTLDDFEEVLGDGEIPF